MRSPLQGNRVGVAWQVAGVVPLLVVAAALFKKQSFLLEF
jgi:hypothetical protein